MQKILFLSLFLISTQLFAQTGNIKGSVITKDGKVAEFVNLILTGTQNGATVQHDGTYVVSAVKPGTYTLKASFVGLETQSKTVTVESGKTSIVDFILTENSKELSEVVVTANPSKYVADYPSVSLRLRTPLLEIPQNVQTVTGQILKDQQIFDMLEGVTRNVSGATRMEHWDNYALHAWFANCRFPQRHECNHGMESSARRHEHGGTHRICKRTCRIYARQW